MCEFCDKASPLLDQAKAMGDYADLSWEERATFRKKWKEILALKGHSIGGKENEQRMREYLAQNAMAILADLIMNPNLADKIFLLASYGLATMLMELEDERLREKEQEELN